MTLVATGLATLALASGLQGVVMRGPTTPVCRVGVPCSEPAAGVTLSFARAASIVYAKTDRHGRYRVALAPGRWKVGVGPKPSIGFVLRPDTVVVPRDRFATVRFDIDTGIR